MQITEALERRTIDYVTREDNGITLVCTDGHSISLFVDENKQIQLGGQNVQIILPGLDAFGKQWV
jgi:hypothetical protein